MKNRIYKFIKWGWIFFVAIFVCFYFKKNFHDLLKLANHLDYNIIFISFIFILIAKILIVFFIKNVLHGIGKGLTLWQCYTIYNISQLGKYLPGNIWHFVGKAAAYKAEGFEPGQIRDALIVENSWLVFSAFFYGVILIFIFDHNLMSDLFDKYKIVFWTLTIILSIIIIFSFKMFKHNVYIPVKNRVINIKIFIIQFFIWSSLGIAFAVLAISFLPQDTEASLFMIIGLYAIAYSIGFVTPFAPAGLGIREAIISMGLLPHISLEVVLLISAINRILYICVEILLAVSTQLYHPSIGN